jgi:predicted ABC-type ATPase
VTQTHREEMQKSAFRNPRIIVVLAGPNGSGKSTFYSEYLTALGMPFVNADLIARETNPTNPAAAAYIAAKAADRRRHNFVKAGKSFCMETVFSDQQGDKIEFLKNAKRNGYTVFLVFICVEDPELCVARVVQRVESGGHDVSDDKIRERFSRSLDNLRKAIEIVDRLYLFDNSSFDDPYRHLATFEQGKLVWHTKRLPLWAKKMVSTHKE